MEQVRDVMLEPDYPSVRRICRPKQMECFWLCGASIRITFEGKISISQGTSIVPKDCSEKLGISIVTILDNMVVKKCISAYLLIHKKP